MLCRCAEAGSLHKKPRLTAMASSGIAKRRQSPTAWFGLYKPLDRIGALTHLRKRGVARIDAATCSVSAAG